MCFDHQCVSIISSHVARCRQLIKENKAAIAQVQAELSAVHSALQTLEDCLPDIIDTSQRMRSASRCDAASPKVPLMDTDNSLPLGNNVLPSTQVPIAQGKLPSSSKAYPQLKPFLLNVNALITGHVTSTKVDDLSQSLLADHSPPGTVRPVFGHCS